jgi:hypothetical protein
VQDRFHQIAANHPMRTLGVAFAASMLMLAWYSNFVRAPRVESIEKQLVNESSQVEPPPGARLIERQAFHKAGFAFATSKYRGPQDWSALQRYYDRALSRTGWIPTRTVEMRDWGKKVNGKMRRYCKNDMSVELQYAGTSGVFNWTYSVTMEWDGAPCK